MHQIADVGGTRQLRHSQSFLDRGLIDLGQPLSCNTSVERAAGLASATERLSDQAVWGAAMDVGEWLKGIGLGQYEATFRAHDLDVDVLADLTEADLEKIGLPLVMKAIANFRPPESLPPLEPLATARELSRPPAAPSPPLRRPRERSAPTPSVARLQSCSATSSVQRAWRRGWTPRTGATWLPRISTKRPQLWSGSAGTGSKGLAMG
jgi:hypothetical protein